MTIASNTAATAQNNTLVQDGARAETLRAALAALAIGVSLVFTVGFAHSSAIHNAAHDTRHALSFPCH
ncbi:MAG: CbtB domain-containing protein [Hyphomicrobium sp.]|jgi:cobalt transporter subunit CbtB